MQRPERKNAVDKLKRLTIHKYRQVKPGTTLHFSDRFNVLLGKNGSGKTTLLNLIAIILSSDFSSLRRQEFSLEYELESPRSHVLVKIQNTKSQSGEQETIPGVPMPRESGLVWSAEVFLIIKESGNQYSCRTSPQGTEVKGSKKSKTEPPIPLFFEYCFLLQAFREILFVEDHDPVEQAEIMSILELQSSRYFRVCRFDESLGVFDAMVKGGLRGTPRDLFCFITFLLVVGNDGKFYGPPYKSFVPEDLAGQVSDRVQGRKESDIASSLEIPQNNVSFLREAVKEMGFRSAQVRVDLTKKEVPDERRRELTFGISGYRFTFRDGTVITHEDLSYGQKRLLSFLYYHAANPQVIVADELVNGFHHQWIEKCMDLLEDRQSFLASQNPLLLDYLPLDSVKEIQESLIQCHLTQHNKRDLMVWKNVADKDARDFYRDLSVGIEHISDLLMARGLW